MESNDLLKLKIKLLQNKTKQFSKENVNKLRSHSDLILALKRKYPIFFNIIDNHGIQYKQFLSAFFNCILNNNIEPFSIRIKSTKNNVNKNNNNNLKIYSKLSANYNYIRLEPWNKYNIIKCYNKYRSLNNETNKITELLRINKEQFMQSLIVLFPEFIKKYPDKLTDLNTKLQKLDSNTISIKHLYNYLIYCGDKLAKDKFINVIRFSKDKYIYKLSKSKVYNFLKIFNYKQLISIIN